jgi:helicase IV
VALTRTKNKCYILFDDKKPSCFVVESYNTNSKNLLPKKNKRICKKCGSYMIKRPNSITNKEFYGCSHYPKCNYTESL